MGPAEISFYAFEQLCAAVERQKRRRKEGQLPLLDRFAAESSVSYKSQSTVLRAERCTTDLFIEQRSSCRATQQSWGTGRGKRAPRVQQPQPQPVEAEMLWCLTPQRALQWLIHPATLRPGSCNRLMQSAKPQQVRKAAPNLAMGPERQHKSSHFAPPRHRYTIL